MKDRRPRQLLESRLKQWNFLEKNIRISSFRIRHQQLAPFFRKEDDLVFYYDVEGLMNVLGIKNDPQEWRLFIDSSKLSLKAVLLHNGNQYPSSPVRHSVHMKETYENLKQLLNKLEYNKYVWYICGDLNVLSLLMVFQLGCTKYCCFLCDWDSRAKTMHYLKRDWHQRKPLKVGEKNVQHPTLAEWHKILLPPLYIRLGLMKNFVKAMDRTGSVFEYLAEKFPQRSEAKIKRGFLWSLRSASSSETICSTNYFRVRRKVLGMRFVWCELTSSGISGHKTTRY